MSLFTDEEERRNSHWFISQSATRWSLMVILVGWKTSMSEQMDVCETAEGWFDCNWEMLTGFLLSSGTLKNKEWELRSHGWVFFFFQALSYLPPRSSLIRGPFAVMTWHIWHGAPAALCCFPCGSRGRCGRGLLTVTLHLQHLQVCDKVRLLIAMWGIFLEILVPNSLLLFF